MPVSENQDSHQKQVLDRNGRMWKTVSQKCEAGPAACQNSRDRGWCEGKWFICRCQPSGRWGTHLKANWGLRSQSPSPPLSGGRGFYKETGEQNRETKGEGCEFAMCSRAQPVLTRQVIVLCAPSWFSHPGFTSCWLPVVLAPRLKVSKPPGAGMLEGWSLSILKPVPRIPTKTCCSSTSHILEFALTETMSREWWGGLQFPTVRIFCCYRSIVVQISKGLI